MFYRVQLTHQSNRTWQARISEFPELCASGATQSEAIVQAMDAVLSVIDDRVRTRQVIPVGSSTPFDGPTLRVPALVAAKVALHNEMRRQGVRKSVMRKRLQWHRPQIDRLLDVRYASKMDQVEKALDALDLELVVAARPVVRRAAAPVELTAASATPRTARAGR